MDTKETIRRLDLRNIKDLSSNGTKHLSNLKPTDLVVRRYFIYKKTSLPRMLFYKLALGSRLVSKVSRRRLAQRETDDIARRSVSHCKVSIIIPTNNGLSKGIKTLIDSLRNQTHENLEFIAIDSGSTDGTPDFLRENDVKVIEIEPKSFTHSFSRNLGATAANGSYLLFTVDDAIFHQHDWISTALRCLEATAADSFSSAQQPLNSADPYAVILSSFLATAQSGNSVGTFVTRQNIFARLFRKILPSAYNYFSFPIDDTNHLVRKQTFDRLKYQGPTVEDIDFAIRLTNAGGRVVYSNILSIQHSHQYSIDDIAKYAKRVYVDRTVLNKWTSSCFTFKSRAEFVTAGIYVLSQACRNVESKMLIGEQYTQQQYRNHLKAIQQIATDINTRIPLHPLVVRVYKELFDSNLRTPISISRRVVGWWKEMINSDMKAAVSCISSADSWRKERPSSEQWLCVVVHLWVARLMACLAEPPMFKTQDAPLACDEWNIQTWQ